MALLLSGCKDYLTEHPTTQPSAVDVFANIDAAKTAITGLYGTTVGGMGAYGYYGNQVFATFTISSLWNTTGLDPTSGGGTIEFQNLATYNIIPTANLVDQAWGPIYRHVFLCNSVIKSVAESGLTDAQKATLTGEAKFLRANDYFNLVRAWGSVPMPLVPPPSLDAYSLPKTPVKDIYDQIISDLENARDNMYDPIKDPVTYANEHIFGRPNAWAAKVLLAKVYATLATNNYMYEIDGVQDPYTPDQRQGFWQKSYDLLKDVHDNGPYKLIIPYNDMFRMVRVGTDESVFEIQWSLSITGQNTISGMTAPSEWEFSPNMNAQNWSGRIRPTRAAWVYQMLKYTTKDPRMVPSQFASPTIPPLYLTGSYKRNKTGGGTTIAVWPSLNVGSGNTPEGFPIQTKYCDPLQVGINSGRTPLILTRYADVLLMLAEAANEIGRPSAEVVGYVNEVLNRARHSALNPDGSLAAPSTCPADWDLAVHHADSTLTSGLVAWNKENLRDSILLEREFEMPMEMHEWFDVRRRGVDGFIKWANKINGITANPLYMISRDQVIDANNGAITKDRRIFIPVDPQTVKKLLRFPIPQSEMNSNTKFTPSDQNYGY